MVLNNLEPRACVPFGKDERLWITPMRYVIRLVYAVSYPSTPEPVNLCTGLRETTIFFSFKISKILISLFKS